MWGMAQMTAPGVNCDIRSFDKSAHLLACPPIKKVFFTEFRQTSPARLFFKMQEWSNTKQEKCY